MLSFLNQYAKNYCYSQNGEEGILLECIARLEDAFRLNKGHAVEIGGHDGRYCSNTALFLQQRGWSGLFVEADYDLHLRSKKNWEGLGLNVRHQCSRVDGRNVNAFVDERCAVLSLDTDGSDYEIFCGLKARPAIVIVEIDSSIEPPSEQVNADGGVGYWTMIVAALERGYMLVAHTGNLLLVRHEYGHLFPECAPHPLLEWELYFNRAWVRG